MKSIRKIFPLIFCLLTCFPASAAESDCFFGGIVTEIPGQRFLANLPAVEFDAGSDPEQLAEVTALVKDYTMTVTCRDEAYELPLKLSWNLDAVNFEIPGTYQLIGDILVPDGCTFAEGVLSQITIPIHIQELPPTEIRTLTTLHNASSLLAGAMLPTGSRDSLKELEQFWIYLLPSIAACNDYGDFAYVQLDFLDDSAVLLDTPGEYTVDFFLRLPDEYAGIYVLDPSISVVHIPIRISGPESFDIWMSRTTSFFFILKFLPRAAETIRIFHTESLSLLSEAELRQMPWALYDTTSGSSGFFALPRPLTLNTYHYFYLDDGISHSNILCLMDNGQEGLVYPLKGDRDGGDAVGAIPPTPEIPNDPNVSLTKPGTANGQDTSASEPETTDRQDASASEPETTAKVSGGLSSDSTIKLTGKTFLTMMQKGNQTARISNDGITATLRQDSLSSCHIKEDSEIRAEVSFISDSEFTLQLTIDDNNVKEIENTKIMVPCKMADTASVPYLIGQGQMEIPADSYDSDLNVASFTINQCGAYTLKEKKTDSPKSCASPAAAAQKAEQFPVPTILTVIFAGAAAIALVFIFFRKRMRR